MQGRLLSSNSGTDTAYIIVNLHSKGRKRSTASYVSELRKKWKTNFRDEKFLFVIGGIINAALNEGLRLLIDVEIKTGKLSTGREAAEIIEAAMHDIPGEIAHANISRVNNVYINVEGRDLGSVVDDVEKRLAELDLPKGVTVSTRGQVKTMREGAANLAYGLLVAVVLVFLILMTPFAFALLPGNEAMIPLARAVIGGMLVSTVLMLFLVPCVFSLVKRKLVEVSV